MLSKNVVVCVLSLVIASVALAEPDTYTVQRASGPIIVDGLIDETDWEAAPSFTPFVFPWWTAGAKEQTEAKMLWDDNFLYVAFRCEDANIWAEYYDTNSATCRDDCVELFWNPVPDRQGGYYMFEMNCIGNLLSVCNDRTTPILENKTLPPHMAQTITGTVNNDSDTDTGWTMEVAVRFTDYNTLSKGRVPVTATYGASISTAAAGRPTSSSASGCLMARRNPTSMSPTISGLSFSARRR